MTNINRNETLKYKLFLSLTAAMLLGFYSVPLANDLKLHILAVYPVLGSLIVWWVIKIQGWEDHPVFCKYHLKPIVAALALGGALGGFPAAVMEVPAQLEWLAIQQEINPIDSIDYRGGGLRKFLIAGITMMGCGQCFWFLWPAAAFTALVRTRPKLVNSGQVIQALVVVYGMVALIPYVNMFLLIFSFTAAFIFLGLIYVPFGWLLS